MKVRVDSERCRGHTLCWLSAPTAFQLSDIDGHVTPAFDEVPTDLQAQMREAVSFCPGRTISID